MGSHLEAQINSAKVLVLGIGNSLLGDDGVGVRLVEELSRHAGGWGAAIEFLDGGTQGLALLGRLEGRRVLVLLDAVALGAAPGTVHILRNQEVLTMGFRSTTAHEGNAGELLRAAMLIGDLPPEVVVVGVEPESVRTGMGLSESVEKAMPKALAAARAVLSDAIVGL